MPEQSVESLSHSPPALGERMSPNFGPRRGVAAPDLVILHYTNMPSAEAALRRLCDPAAQVSAHYLIAADGEIWRLVAEEQRAWHAGVSEWRVGAADADVNSRSIGIELAHPGHDEAGVCPPFPEAQMAALEALLRDVLARRGLSASCVLAHSDVAPGRKIDPGEKFDWGRLARRGLARALPEAAGAVDKPVGSAPPNPIELRTSLARIGYGVWPDQALLDAFRRRWRPSALGRAVEMQDIRLAQALAEAEAPA